MSGFEFENDRKESQVGKAASELANGKLPGAFGVIQDLAHHWAISKRNRGLIRYSKALLDSFGTLYTYHQNQKDSREEGADPCAAWLKKKGFERIFPNSATAFESFIYRALRGVEFRNITVKPDKEQKRGNLIVFDISDSVVGFFIPSDSKSSTLGSTVSYTWDGPFIRPEDKEVFVEFLRERVWSSLNTKTTLITMTGSDYYAQVSLNPLTDALDFTAGVDSYNDTDKIAKRCKAFLDCGLSRAILFHGPPGTGKTTLSRILAQKMDARCVIIDHSAIGTLTKSIQLIIWLLGPRVVIFNDVDRGDSEDHKVLLNALESNYVSQSKMLTCLTINDITQLDPALLRPGRINEVREVPEPSPESVMRILDYYLGKYDVHLQERTEVAKQLNGFSPADIREFVETALAVGMPLARGEISRIKEQRKHYSGDRCRKFNEGVSR